MVLQSFNLFPHRTALEKVAEGPRVVKGLSKTEAAEIGRQHMVCVGLGDKSDAYPNRLSGGQQ